MQVALANSETRSLIAAEQRLPPELFTLQLGLGWFPEQAGGLERFYQDMLLALPAAQVRSAGLVAGSAAVVNSSAGVVSAFAGHDAPLHLRLMGIRKAVANELRRRQCDLLVSHFALYTYPVLSKCRSLPLVVHFHGPWAGEAGSEGRSQLTAVLKKHIERRVYGRADRVIVLSSAFARIAREQYGVPKDRIRIIPGGINADRYDIPESRTEARHCLGWSTQRPTVLAVRRLINRMGLEDLINAARIVREQVPDVLFLIGGKGILKEKLAAQIASLGLGETVKLLGFLPDTDLPLAYRAADLTIVPTVALEGFGLVAAESLAAGTPALVTPVGGLPEVVDRLSRHLLFPNADATEMANQIAAALRGVIKLPSSFECAAFARQNFDWPVIARRIAAVYREAVVR